MSDYIVALLATLLLLLYVSAIRPAPGSCEVRVTDKAEVLSVHCPTRP